MIEARETTTNDMALRLLPEELLRLPLADLALPEPLLAAALAAGRYCVTDLLTLTGTDAEWLDADAADAIRTAIGLAIDRRLPRRATMPFEATDWPSLQGHLLIPLDDEQRALLRALLGIDEAPQSAVQYARHAGADSRAVEALAESARIRLHERSQQLIARLREELQLELAAADGLLDPQYLATGSMLDTMARANDDASLPLRLAAFCFPHEYHLHGGLLVATSPRGLRRLVDLMRSTLVRQRLPCAVDDLLGEINGDRKPVQRGLVMHLLRNELRLAITITEQGEIIVPDPKSPASRLAELLEEEGAPMQFTDLVFAYRERYRRATPHRLEEHLRRDPTFVPVGGATFALRRWHTDSAERAAGLADRAARHVCAEGGKQDVLAWLAQTGCDETMAWLVLDCLRQDERVRLLGRGEACPAMQRRSQVMLQLLADFRRACGDVVESMFVGNQPLPRRRLVQRLLAQNRMFLRPEPDRVDTLTNYPFNEARLRRLRKLTRQALESQGGYADIATIVAACNATDLGGSWLTPYLLTEVLRRQGWFDVLPGGILALGDRGLAQRLLRLARQELRGTGVLLSVDEIVRHRPELDEFRGCLTELLDQDPLVQSPDGWRFGLV